MRERELSQPLTMPSL